MTARKTKVVTIVRNTCGSCYHWEQRAGERNSGNCYAHPPPVHYNFEEQYAISTPPPRARSDRACGEYSNRPKETH